MSSRAQAFRHRRRGQALWRPHPRPRRKPEESDAVDLRLSVIALSYCDLLLAADGYVPRVRPPAGQDLARAHDKRPQIDQW